LLIPGSDNHEILWNSWHALSLSDDSKLSEASLTELFLHELTERPRSDGDLTDVHIVVNLLRLVKVKTLKFNNITIDDRNERCLISDRNSITAIELGKYKLLANPIVAGLILPRLRSLTITSSSCHKLVNYKALKKALESCIDLRKIKFSCFRGIPYWKLELTGPQRLESLVLIDCKHVEIVLSYCPALLRVETSEFPYIENYQPRDGLHHSIVLKEARFKWTSENQPLRFPEEVHFLDIMLPSKSSDKPDCDRVRVPKVIHWLLVRSGRSTSFMERLQNGSLAKLFPKAIHWLADRNGYNQAFFELLQQQSLSTMFL